MDTTRKAWISPQVFVLGAEGTASSAEPGSKEEYVVGGWICTDKNDPTTCTPVGGGWIGFNGSV